MINIRFGWNNTRLLVRAFTFHALAVDRASDRRYRGSNNNGGDDRDRDERGRKLAMRVPAEQKFLGKFPCDVP